MAAPDVIPHLIALLAKHKGDLAAALEELFGFSITQLAELVDLPRQTVGQALDRADGREYKHVFRALEPALGMAPFDMDKVLEGYDARR